jgi:uncharacterized protein (DUF2267 family)
MSATGLDVFDKTLQTTNIWLDQIMQEIGPDRKVAWHVLGATLRVLRDRLMIGLAANLGSQMPLPRKRPLLRSMVARPEAD